MVAVRAVASDQTSHVDFSITLPYPPAGMVSSLVAAWIEFRAGGCAISSRDARYAAATAASRGLASRGSRIRAADNRTETVVPRPF